MIPWLKLFVLATLTGQLSAQDYVRLTVSGDVFTVLESDSFKLTCTAKYEEKKPMLRWYRVDNQGKRVNITVFAEGSATGKVITVEHRFSNARLSHTGDYYCEAEVDGIMTQSVNAFPINVIKKDKEPQLEVKKIVVRNKPAFLCSVVPLGYGDLEWRKDADLLLSKEKTTELVLESLSRGIHKCHGNLTIGGYKFFERYASISGATGLTTRGHNLVAFWVCLLSLPYWVI